MIICAASKSKALFSFLKPNPINLQGMANIARDLCNLLEHCVFRNYEFQDVDFTRLQSHCQKMFGVLQFVREGDRRDSDRKLFLAKKCRCGV